MAASGTVLGGFLALTASLFSIGFGPAFYNFFFHPTIAVSFFLTRLQNGLYDRIAVSNQGNAAATNLLLTISAPQQVRGQILLTSDRNTTVDNESHCGFNCFSVSIPTFSYGSGQLKLSSLISNKSNITGGNYTLIASYSGTSARFVQPLLGKPQGALTSTLNAGSPSILTTFVTGGILSAAATAYIFVSRRRVKSRDEVEPRNHVTNITNIDIENVFMAGTPDSAEEMIKRFGLRGEKQE
jgi:hypothetical protein